MDTLEHTSSKVDFQQGGKTPLDPAQLNVTKQVLMGLRDHRNFAGKAFLDTISQEFGDELKSLDKTFTPISLIRKLESLQLIEVRSFDARKNKEEPVWNLTPIGAVWLAIFDQTDKVSGGDGGSASVLNSTFLSTNVESLIDYSVLDIEASLMFLRRQGLLGEGVSGYFMSKSPLDTL